MEIVSDFLGNEIKVGDFVIYPVRHGSSLWMSTAEVVKIRDLKYRWSASTKKALVVLRRSIDYRGVTKEKTVTLVCLDRVAVVPGMTWKKFVEMDTRRRGGMANTPVFQTGGEGSEPSDVTK